ncbi:nucleoside deaminase [Flavobacteriales bacterium]|nr:nucleoside deaminase [Flavobacteriales bacterium]
MIEQPLSDEYYMRKALHEAETAFSKNEVPVGAIIVCKNKIIARSHNLTEKLTDFTAHAEMQVFTAASEFLQNKYLNECTIYVTLEPCLMCAGASFWTRIGRIVYGASDHRRGFKSFSENVLHPSTVINGGVLEAECSSLLTSFFSAKRK